MSALWMHAWNYLRFSHQLLIIVGISFSLLSVGLLLLLTQQALQDAQNDLQAELSHELVSLPPLVSDLVVIGDYASLEQLLNQQTERQLIDRITFTDDKGATVVAQSASTPIEYPAWFDSFFTLQSPAEGVSIRAGKKVYGTLDIQTRATALSNRLWQHFLTGLIASVLAWQIIWLLLWFIIRKGLEPLDKIHRHTVRFSQGDLGDRIEV